MYKIVSVVAALGLLSGCASLVTDNAKTVSIQTSNNEKVEVQVDGQKFTAPTVVKLVKDGTDKVITTDDKKCAGTTVAKKKIEPAFFGNIIIGGVIGSTTDAVGKKMWTYDDTVTISCQ